MLVFQLCAILMLQALIIEATREELIETLQFKPNKITKQTILRDYQLMNDDFFNPNNRESIVQFAYITPWNKRGYELAEKTAHKLTHVSPVWFQAKAELEDGKLQTCRIEGIHEINREWIGKLLEKNENIKIVPRILFDGWNRDEMKNLLDDTQAALRCFRTIAEFYSRNNFDGAVIEFYLQALISLQSLEAKEFIIESVQQLSKQMQKFDLSVITTVPAPLEWDNKPNNLITPAEFKKLQSFSDFVQIMTYDYRGNKPTGVAPYDWFENCLFYLAGEQSKTLAGINYYGYKFSQGGVDAVTADEFLKTLQEEKTKLMFDEDCMEHKLRTPFSIIYFPTLTSIELRTNMAHRYNIGIAIWDYGQGLDYFTNLLV